MRVETGGDQELCGHVGTDAVRGPQGRVGCGDERVDPAGAASLVPRVAVRPYAALGTLDVVAIVVERPSLPQTAARPAAVGSPGGGSYPTPKLAVRIYPQPTRRGG